MEGGGEGGGRANLLMQNMLAVGSYECLLRCGKSSVGRSGHVPLTTALSAWFRSRAYDEETRLL